MFIEKVAGTHLGISTSRTAETQTVLLVRPRPEQASTCLVDVCLQIVTAAKVFAARKYDNEDMWRAASQQLLRHMGGMTPQQLQNIAWAWAVRRVPDPTLYEVNTTHSCFS